MSRLYEMSVSISNYNEKKSEAIEEAINGQWEFDDFLKREHQEVNYLDASGQGYLSGGDSEEDFVEQISKAIWEANGKVCNITVNCTYLENIPFESYDMTDKYDEIMKE